MFKALRAAFGLLTRLPVRPAPLDPEAVWAFPLAGLAVGAIAALLQGAGPGPFRPLEGQHVATAKGEDVVHMGAGAHRDGPAHRLGDRPKGAAIISIRAVPPCARVDIPVGLKIVVFVTGRKGKDKCGEKKKGKKRLLISVGIVCSLLAGTFQDAGKCDVVLLISCLP